MPMKVLIVDDEPNILDIVEAYLAAKKYQVYRAESGAEALEKFHAFHPDLIVLDLMLPDMTGGDVCTKIREESNVPIIMLTARSSEKDILSGLQIGADDYIVKPFSPKELVARVETVLRRVAPADAEEKWNFDGGELVILPKTKQPCPGFCGQGPFEDEAGAGERELAPGGLRTAGDQGADLCDERPCLGGIAMVEGLAERLLQGGEFGPGLLELDPQAEVIPFEPAQELRFAGAHA